MKLNNIINSKKFTVIASFVGLYFLSVGISLLFFSLVPTQTISSILPFGQGSKINLNLPKTQECPINGQKYTKPEENVWDGRRPITAVIENHVDARPESGLGKADVIYEAVAEGGITRFMGVFYCGVAAETVKLSPIRSARIYFVNLASGYGQSPIFLHQGGANNFCPNCPGGVKPKGEIDPKVDAYAKLDDLGWRNGQSGNDMDGGYNVGYPVVVRDQYRLSSEPAAWEHSVVADIFEVYKEAEKRGFKFKDEDGVAWNKGFKKWLFQDGKSSGNTSNIKFEFWANKPEYDVEWQYDSATNSYKRLNGSKAHIDWEGDKSQLTAKNVVIMFAEEEGPVDREHHMYYEVLGEGEAVVFQNGEAIEGKWVKDTNLDREVFYDKNGDEIKMVRGQTWIEIVPAGNTINY